MGAETLQEKLLRKEKEEEEVERERLRKLGNPYKDEFDGQFSDNENDDDDDDGAAGDFGQPLKKSKPNLFTSAHSSSKYAPPKIDELGYGDDGGGGSRSGGGLLVGYGSTESRNTAAADDGGSSKKKVAPPVVVVAEATNSEIQNKAVSTSINNSETLSSLSSSPAQPLIAPSSPASTASTNVKTVFCIECGKQINAAHKFCRFCGTKTS